MKHRTFFQSMLSGGLFCALAFNSLMAHAAVPQPLPLTPPAQWPAQQAKVEADGDAVKLVLPSNYVIGRVTSPATPAGAGELFTLSVAVTTRFASRQGGSFYRFFLEIECLQAGGVVQTFASPDLLGTRDVEQSLAVTAVVPQGATAVRAVLCAQNKMWSFAENQALVRDVRLCRLAGRRGGQLRIETIAEMKPGVGNRAARLAVRGDWPDGAAVSLTTSRGEVPSSLLFAKGQAECALHYKADDVGAALVNARIADEQATVRLADPQAATLSLQSTHAESRAIPILVQLTRDRKMLPGRYPTILPGFFVTPPWSIDLPPGRWQLRVCRGPLFTAFEQTFDATRGTAITLDLPALERRVDPSRFGWYGGDADGDVYHGEEIYDDVTAADAAQIAQAMGLDWVGVANWRKPEPKTWGEARAGMKSWSHPGFLYTWADERKSEQGHICLAGLERPDAEAFDWGWQGKTAHPLRNFEYLQLIRASGGATFVNHPLRWWTSEGRFVTNMYSSLAFDLCAAGLIDGFNINEKATELALWSMLLDHGYRVTATAGADFCLDRPNGPLPGSSARMYCYCPDGMSAPALSAAVRQGRTIISTGPVLLADIDGQQPGATVAPGKTYAVHGRAWSRGDRPDQLTRLELFAHGRVIATHKLAAGTQEAETTFQWTPSGPWDWVAVRAVAQSGWAITSAFYAAGSQWRPPQPVQCKMTLDVTGLDAEQLGKTMLEVWDNTPGLVTSKVISRGPLPQDKTLTVPVSATLVLQAPGGRRKELAVYDALGMPEWIGKIASGVAKEGPLRDWETYEDCLRRCRQTTAKIAF